MPWRIRDRGGVFLRVLVLCFVGAGVPSTAGALTLSYREMGVFSPFWIEEDGDGGGRVHFIQNHGTLAVLDLATGRPLFTGPTVEQWQTSQAIAGRDVGHIAYQARFPYSRLEPFGDDAFVAVVGVGRPLVDLGLAALYRTMIFEMFDRSYLFQKEFSGYATEESGCDRRFFREKPPKAS